MQGSASALRSVARAAAALLLAAAGACQAVPDPPAPRAARPRQPQSSLAALVRALEAVDAIRDPRGYIRVRAVESDSILDRKKRSEYARVLLDLTVYARDVLTARKVFEELALHLEAEAQASERLDVVPHHRAERVFRQMNWDADGLPEDCLSYSDVLRLEMQRGERPTVTDERNEPHEPGPSSPADEYVHTIAESADVGIGPVMTDLRIVRPVPDARDLRIHIKPASRDAHFTRERIGNFLTELEARSPLARITHVQIARALHLPSWPNEDGWTFEAILTLRYDGSS